MSDTDASDRNWRTTVINDRGGRYSDPLAYTYEHRGPADFKVDAAGTLRVEVYPENSDFEVVIALHRPNTWLAVSQEVLPEEDAPTPEMLESLRKALSDEDREIQVHDPDEAAGDW